MVWSGQQTATSVWKLAARQHGVIARTQLLEAGLSPRAIEHRVAKGRLHAVAHGVFAVGRPEVNQRGRWMATVLSCGSTAVLSHRSAAAALWRMDDDSGGSVHISVRVSTDLRRSGVHVHRRPTLRASDTGVCKGIPVTAPARTLIDLATELDAIRLERAINEADKHDLITPHALRLALGAYRGQPGVRRLRMVLDRRTFRLTDSELERYFLPIVDQVGLPRPLTQRYVNGFKVDFFWPDLGLVIETDGLRYHRTPAEQARDRLRDQTHTAAGLTQLRFGHAQVRYESAHVREVLTAVARRLASTVDA